MKVELVKIFPMPVPAHVAWQFLQNIEGVAGCMPGARITERIDDANYKGTVTVRFGPATMSFKGDIEVKGVDPASRSVHMVGKGSDSTGTSGASMDLTARIEAVDQSTCRLVGNSEVSMSGKAAAFGGRMMNTVADQLLKKFADNFSAQLQAQSVTGAAQQPAADRTPGGSPEAAALPVAAELNGLALFWAVVRDWFLGLFSRKPG